LKTQLMIWFSSALLSLTTMADTDAVDAVRFAFQENSKLPVEEVTVSQMPGLYEVVLSDGTVLFADQSGTYFIVGDLYQATGRSLVNLSDARRNDQRKKLIAALDESEMVVFSPKPGMKKTAITVFTDIDCGYCRKLHQEVPELNRLGIEVRYLAYPRAGLESESYDKIVSAWCADDQRSALTRAKTGKKIESRDCKNPVAQHFALGGAVGVTGTPSIIFEDGRLLPGYLPAERLAQQLGIASGG